MFFDTNIYIEEKEGKKLRSIISEKGIEYFKSLEKYTMQNKIIHEMIVSTGATLVSDEECRHIIKKTGRVIYLKSDIENIYNNLKENYSEYLDNSFSIFSVDKELSLYKPYYEELENYIITVDGKSIEIGEIVLKKLKKVDDVAYIRFASVYREFKEVENFNAEVAKIKSPIKKK